MFKKSASAAIGALLLVSPLIASAQTSSVQSQIDALLALIKQLTAQIAQLQGGQSTTSCVDISSNLTLGSSGSEVTNLQKYLTQKGYFSADATGYYGFITAQAVGKLQIALGILSSADDPSYGIMGPRTRAAIACTSVNPSPVSSASASITSSLTVTEKHTTTISGIASNVGALNISVGFPNGGNVVRTVSVVNGAWSETYEGFPYAGNYTIIVSSADYLIGTILAQGTLKVVAAVGASICRVDYPEGANIRSSTQSSVGECKAYCDLYGNPDATTHGGATVCKFQETQIASYSVKTCSVDYPEGANIRSSFQQTSNECKTYCDAYGSSDAASHGGAAVCKFQGSQIGNYSF